jgi:hypothetical protein
MAEEKKKTKIDLKARLGKTVVGMSAPPQMPAPAPGIPGMPPQGMPGMPGMPSAPAPGIPGDRVSGLPQPPGSAPSAHPPPRPSAPLGIAPPPGLSPGIPLPPFAPQPRQVRHAEPKPSAAQQTIKVEVGEEVEQERKKLRRQGALYAALAAVVALGVGWAIGGQQEASKRGYLAVAGAGALEKDVKVAHDKMQELTEKLGEAGTKLGNKTYPDDLATALGGINIPFDATNLEGKQVGSLQGKVLRALLAFTSGCQDLNTKKDALKNLITAAQAPITKSWKEEKDPLAGYSVLFRNDNGKAAAELVTNKEPFPWGKDWPGSFTVTKQENHRPSDKKVNRWVKGDILPANGDAMAIPVDPQSVAVFTSEEVVFKLGKALRDLREDLEGNKDNPQNEKSGLIKDGDDLANELHKIALAR